MPTKFSQCGACDAFDPWVDAFDPWVDPSDLTASEPSSLLASLLLLSRMLLMLLLLLLLRLQADMVLLRLLAVMPRPAVAALLPVRRATAASTMKVQ